MTPAPLPPVGDDGPLIGELFAGYGGLGMGVQAVFGGRIAWVSDVCKFDKDGNAGHYSPHRAPCSMLAHRHPDVPNLGDVTKIDWTTVPRVHVLTGGSPCQDLSHAGRRAGMTEGTRSNLWVAMREAIAILRPSVVIWENVRGALTAEADSELVTDPRLLADLRRRDGEPVLRAAGRVVGDLSELGYDSRWHSLRAADIGAPHGRFRVFVGATDASSDPWWERHRDGGAAALAGGVRRDARRPAGPGEAAGGRPSADPAGRDDAPAELTLLGTPRCADAVSHDLRDPDVIDDAKSRLEDQVALLGTPTARMWKGSGQPGSASHDWLMEHGNVEAQVLALPDAGPLLPTPAVNDMGAAYTPEEWDEWTDRMKAEHGNGNGHGKSLEIEAQRLADTPLLPTPRAAADRTSRGSLTRDGHWSAPALGQAVELAQGILPREYESWDEVQGSAALLPTPSAALGTGGQTSRSGDRIDEPLLGGIAEAATAGRLLPTPVATDGSDSARHTTTTGVAHPGTTLTDATRALGKVTSDPAERTSDARARKDRPAPSLFDLRDAAGQEEVREAVGGPDAVPVSEDLRPELREQPPRGDEERAPRAGDEAPGEAVPGLRDDDGAACSPRGPGRDERRPGEPDDALRVLPPETPLAGGPGEEAGGGTEWGDYAPAIRRWERILGRVAPHPTQPSKKGNPQLAASFVEFMMGLPPGWVVDVPGSTRNEQLKALGNGVVPQQAAAALAIMFSWRLP